MLYGILRITRLRIIVIMIIVVDARFDMFSQTRHTHTHTQRHRTVSLVSSPYVARSRMHVGMPEACERNIDINTRRYCYSCTAFRARARRVMNVPPPVNCVFPHELVHVCVCVFRVRRNRTNTRRKATRLYMTVAPCAWTEENTSRYFVFLRSRVRHVCVVCVCLSTETMT